MDRQVVRRDDVALLGERTQVYPSGPPEEQVDHSTASLAHEMIVLAGFGIEPGPLFVQEDGADFALLNQTVKVAIYRGKADSRQLLVYPPINVMGGRMAMIALESFEHLLQLTCSTSAGGPPHRLTSNPGHRGGLGSNVTQPLMEAVIKSKVPCQGGPIFEPCP